MTRPGGPRCAQSSRAAGEPLAGSAPRADIWVIVEHPQGWGDAHLARASHGVRVVMARGARPGGEPPAGASAHPTSGALLPTGGWAGAVPTPPARVWVAHCSPEPTLRVWSVADPHEVADWDLAGIAAGSHRDWGRPVEGPLLAVCANGRRDRCCGHEGGRLADALWAGPHHDRVITCTHLGGHRFAPTALLLPWGVLHGHLDPTTAEGLVDAAAAGWTPTGTLRGSSTQEPPAQVAEAHARRVTGYRGLTPLPVALAGDPRGELLAARVSLPGGDTIDVRLVRSTEQRQLSCGRAPEPTPHWTIA